MIPLSERIKMLVEYSGLSISAFSQHIGLKSPSAIRELINGRTKALSEIVRVRLLSAYPNINQSWLCRGEGEMFLPAPHTTTNVSGHNVCGVNVNGRDIDIKCPTEYEALLGVVKAHNEVVTKMQSQLDKAQSQIDELIAMLKAKS